MVSSELRDVGDLSIVTAAEQLVRTVVDRLRDEGHRTVAAQEVRATRVTRFETEGDIPRTASRTSRVATIITVGSSIDWRDRTAKRVSAVEVPPALVRQVVVHRWQGFAHREGVRQSIGHHGKIDPWPESSEHAANIDRVARISVIGTIRITHRNLRDADIRVRFRTTPRLVGIVTAWAHHALRSGARHVIHEIRSRVEVVARAATVRQFACGGLHVSDADSDGVQNAFSRIDRLIHPVLFHLRKHVDDPRTLIAIPVTVFVRTVAGRRQTVERVVEGVHRDPELLEVVLALRAGGRFAYLLDGGQ